MIEVFGCGVRTAVAVWICGAGLVYGQGPSNDDRASARAVSGWDWETSGTTFGATAEPGEPNHGGQPASQSVWFRWTAESESPFRLEVEGGDPSRSPRLGVYLEGGSESAFENGEPPVVYLVIDRSTSTHDYYDGKPVGLVNADGYANRVLDAEIAGALMVLEELRWAGFAESADVGVIDFANGAWFRTRARLDEDLDRNLIPDVEDNLRSIRVGLQGTNYEAAFQRVLEQVAKTPPGRPVSVFFFSDGEPTRGGDYSDEVAALRGAGVEVRAFGTGRDARLQPLLKIDPRAMIFDDPAQVREALRGTVASSSGAAANAGTRAGAATFLAQAGASYRIAVDGAGGEIGFTLKGSRVSGLSVGDVPSTYRVDEGGRLSLAIPIEGVGDVRVQWFRNGSWIGNHSGAEVLVIDPVTPADAGLYVAEVSNGFGFARTPVIAVEVAPDPPVLESGLFPVSVGGGAPLRLAVRVSSTAPVIYTWRRDGEIIAIGAEGNFFVPKASDGHAGHYTVTAGNGGGTVSSGPVEVRVTDPLAFQWEGIDAVLQPGSEPRQAAGGKFFAWGQYGVFMSSADGAEWELCRGAGHFWEADVAYRDGVFLMAVNGGKYPGAISGSLYRLFRSADGVEWTEVPNPLNLSALAAGDAGWVAVRSEVRPDRLQPNPLYFSADGVSWEALEFFGSSEILLPFGSTWKYHSPASSSEPTDWRVATFDDSGWASGAAPLGYGTPGLRTTLPADSGGLGIAKFFRTQLPTAPAETSALTVRVRGGDGIRVAWGHPSHPYRFLENLEPPLSAASPAVVELDEAEEGIRSVTIGHTNFGDPPTIAAAVHPSSGADPDLSFDLEIEAHVASLSHDIIPWNGLFISVGQDGRIFVSADGRTWDGVEPRLNLAPGEPLAQISQRGWAASPDRFLAYASFGPLGRDAAAVWSEDGVNWQRSALTGTGPLVGEIVWTGERFAVPNHWEGRSDDGLQWTLHKVGSDHLDKFFETEGKWLAYSEDKEGFETWTRLEGGDWTQHVSPYEGSVMRSNITNAGQLRQDGGFVVTGTSLFSADGESWQHAGGGWSTFGVKPAGVRVGGLMYVVDETPVPGKVRVGTMPALITGKSPRWSEATVSGLSDRFIPSNLAAVERTLVAIDSIGRVIVSENLGKSWTLTRAEPASRAWGSLLVSKGLLFLSASGHLDVSTDRGLTWTLRQFPDGKNVSEIAWFEGRFVARVATNPDPEAVTEIWTSPDGIAWQRTVVGNFGARVDAMTPWGELFVIATELELLATRDFATWQLIPRPPTWVPVSGLASLAGSLFASVRGASIFRLGDPVREPLGLEMEGLPEAATFGDLVTVTPRVVNGSAEGATVEYLLDGLPFGPGSGPLEPFQFRIRGEGRHVLTARLVDAAGRETFATIGAGAAIVDVAADPQQRVFPQPPEELRDVTFHPASGWFALPGAGRPPLRSSDGQLWRNTADPELGGGSSEQSLAVAPDGSLWLARGLTLVRSEDAGETWQPDNAFGSLPALSDSFGTVQWKVVFAPTGAAILFDGWSSVDTALTIRVSDPDGSNWESFELPGSSDGLGFPRAASADGQVVLVGQTAGGAASWTTEDGVTWSGPHPLPVPAGLAGRVAVGHSGATWAAAVMPISAPGDAATTYRTSDGRVWQRTSVAIDASTFAPTVAPPGFLATNNRTVSWSPDAEAWQAIPSEEVVPWNAAEVEPGRIVSPAARMSAESLDGGLSWEILSDHRVKGSGSSLQSLDSNGEVARILQEGAIFKTLDAVRWERELPDERVLTLRRRGDRWLATAITAEPGVWAFFEATGAEPFVPVDESLPSPAVAFAGDGETVVALTPDGIAYSPSAGAAWEIVMPFAQPATFEHNFRGLAYVGVRFLVFLDPVTVGTAGGLWYSTDGRTWNRSPSSATPVSVFEFGGSVGDYWLRTTSSIRKFYRTSDPALGWEHVPDEVEQFYHDLGEGIWVRRLPDPRTISADGGKTWAAFSGAGGVRVGASILNNVNSEVWRRMLDDLWCGDLAVEGGGAGGAVTLCDPVVLRFEIGNAGFLSSDSPVDVVLSLEDADGNVLDARWDVMAEISPLEPGVAREMTHAVELPPDLPPGRYRARATLAPRGSWGSINTANDVGQSAPFSLDAVPVDIGSGPGGFVLAATAAGTPLGDGGATGVARGAQIALEAVAVDAAGFGGWRVNGAPAGVSPAFALVVVEPSIVEADFVPFVTPEVHIWGGGSITYQIPGGGPEVAADVAVTALAEPDAGWAFAGWLGRGGSRDRELQFLPDPGMAPPRAVFVRETSYETWATDRGLADPLRDPVADADRNGAANLLDYAKGHGGLRPL